MNLREMKMLDEAYAVHFNNDQISMHFNRTKLLEKLRIKRGAKVRYKQNKYSVFYKGKDGIVLKDDKSKETFMVFVDDIFEEVDEVEG